MQGYLALPDGWERVSAGGPGPFVTTEVFRRPDGTLVRWHSRAYRKGSHGHPAAAAEPVWWRPRRRSWWMAVLFSLGSVCFVVGAVASQWGSSSRPAIGVVFFVGSIFFTAAGYLQYAEVASVGHSLDAARSRRRWRPASWEPKRIDWLAALVQLIGTVLFNVSTFAALNHDLTAHQSNVRVWAPDVFGSAAFLIASTLAFAEVCHRWICLRRRSLSWWIVAINLLGSIAFGVSAIASLTEPNSGLVLAARIANAGTSVGGLCFLAGALLLMPEAAAAERLRAAPREPALLAPE